MCHQQSLQINKSIPIKGYRINIINKWTKIVGKGQRNQDFPEQIPEKAKGLF